jgi:SNF2 family DNA or RNA helicase
MLVQIKPAGQGKAEVKPGQYLGGADAFMAFREACAKGGAKYNQKIKGNLLPVERIAQAKGALEAAGFEVEIDQDLVAGYREQWAASNGRIERAKARVAVLKAVLSKMGFDLPPYQEEGILWLAGRKRGFLADEPGLGKTLQLLTAIDDDFRCVWVCPASLKLNARDEFAMFRPGTKVTILEGMDSFRWPERNEVVVLNYDILPGTIDKSGKKHRVIGIPEVPAGAPLHLIADEAHFLKGSKAQRTMKFRALSDAVLYADGTAWGASGTEMPNRPGELWNVYTAFDIAVDAFGSWARFCNLFGGYRGSFGMQWDAQRKDAEVVSCIRNVSIKRLKKDVMKELPEKRYQQVIVPLDGETKLLCDRVVAHLKEKGIDVNEIEDIVRTTREDGATFELLSKAMAALSAAKASPALDIIETYEEAGEPLVVFSQGRAPIEVIAKRPGWGVIHGSIPTEERQATKNAFMDGRLKGIAGTIGAMGVGLTLTRAKTLIRISRAWTPAENRQAEDRIHRKGQREGVLIIDLVGDHELDRNLTRTLVKKEDVISRTTEAAAVLPGAGNVDRGALDLSVLQAVSVPVQRPAEPMRAWRTVPTGQRVQVDSVARRPAKTQLEEWAGLGIRLLSDMDSDKARVINSEGFSKMDSDFGNKLAMRLQDHGGLSDREWEAAIRLARKYRRQFGAEPN